MGYVIPLPPIRLEGLHCPVCWSMKVERVSDFWSLFILADRRRCSGCGFGPYRVESFYRGPNGCMWVEDI